MDEVRPFTVEQARRFLESVRGDRLEALYGVALCLGLRLGEVLGLTWSAVDEEAQTLTVRATLQRYGGAYHLNEPTSARSRRTIPLPRPVAEALRTRRVAHLSERLAAGPGWVGNEWDLVFTTPAGEPLASAVVTRHFHGVVDVLGLPQQRFHNCRHAVASFALAQGVPMRVVMEVLGHSHIGVTADLYSHVDGHVEWDAVERISAVLWGDR